MAGNALSLKYGETKLCAATLRGGTAGVICRVRNRRCENNQAEPSQSTQRPTRLRITHLSPPFSIFGSIHVAEPFFNGAPVEQVVRFLERSIGWRNWKLPKSVLPSTKRTTSTARS